MVVGASDASQPTVQLPNHLAPTQEKEGERNFTAKETAPICFGKGTF